MHDLYLNEYDYQQLIQHGIISSLRLQLINKHKTQIDWAIASYRFLASFFLLTVYLGVDAVEIRGIYGYREYNVLPSQV
ncbi:hypothetical protein IQ244_24760 [Nostoc sp. LEGE 06077]|uniref:hypothetical protein n=1 Tax=Nostoc sp. LEGE 06077 TaxID=915325 RepID=UPI0018810D58|nr:hypothetical protein [Nostoc sp. LEGE 06077]MBE9209646.1 hypothetical protein [Nostoc sp. LEGE 06077]